LILNRPKRLNAVNAELVMDVIAIAGVTNLGNKRYFPVASADLAVKGSAEAHPGRPREWYLMLKYSF